jgi:1,4-dihydroxy-2-naphthoyl-CoA hydrolase
VTESIWFATPTAAALNTLHEDTAVSQLGIEIIEVGADYLSGRMPVDNRTIQPFGLMHGGAAVLLLETLASAAANHCVDLETHICVGVEVNCNHIRSVKAGTVIGRAQALHVGRSSMVWALEARDEQQRLVTVGRLTTSIVNIKKD